MDGQTKQSLEDDFCDKKEEATDKRIKEELKTNELSIFQSGPLIFTSFVFESFFV